MPPHTFLTDALHRYMLLLTVLVASSAVVLVGFAGAGGVDPECRGNAPKKLCPKLKPATGETVSGKVLVSVEVTYAAGVLFTVNDSPLGPEDITQPYEIEWDTTKVPNGQYTIAATARLGDGKTSIAESVVQVSNAAPADTAPPSVQLTSPAAGATLSGSAAVSADASDNVAVAGVQFKLDGSTLGNEDTSAPYSVGWDTTKSVDGWHTLTAVARDASGNTSSSQRAVKVSNQVGDTTAPSVQFTSPAGGATVSGQTALTANASDNVAVVGVQFKLGGANLGAEDTSSPYSVGWDTTKSVDGWHTLTAVARDAAGNSSSSQRNVIVSNTTAPPPSGGSPLTWAPPALTNPVTINVGNANRRLFLDNSRDYRLNIVEPLKRELWIEGGRNVVVIGGHITIDQLGGASSYQDNTGVKVRFGDPSGTVHLEGLLIDGTYVADGIGIATSRNVQIQNVRVEHAYDGIKGAHPDCVQLQQGVGHLRMDRFTCTSDLQGIFLGDHDGAIRSADLRRINMYGAPGKHLFWQTTPTYSVTLSDVWLAMPSPWASFGYWVYPQADGRVWDGTYDLTRRSVVSLDGSYLVFVGSTNNISGRIFKGVPSSGDFAPRSSVGSGYISPGY